MGIHFPPKCIQYELELIGYLPYIISDRFVDIFFFFSFLFRHIFFFMLVLSISASISLKILQLLSVLISYFPSLPLPISSWDQNDLFGLFCNDFNINLIVFFRFYSLLLAINFVFNSFPPTWRLKYCHSRSILFSFSCLFFLFLWSVIFGILFIDLIVSKSIYCCLLFTFHKTTVSNRSSLSKDTFASCDRLMTGIIFLIQNYPQSTHRHQHNLLM